MDDMTPNPQATPGPVWKTQRHGIDLSSPVIMGIVNLTPDSFSDGGRHDAPSQGMAHCELLLSQGAGILDLGAESSRPGALPLPLEEERKRLMPVLRHALTLGCPVSIDTYKPEIMAEALDMGADIINDIHGFSRPGAIEAVAAFPGAGLCVMHMQGTPATMQANPTYDWAPGDVYDFLGRRIAVCAAAGGTSQRSGWTVRTHDPALPAGDGSAANVAASGTAPAHGAARPAAGTACRSGHCSAAAYAGRRAPGRTGPAVTPSSRPPASPSPTRRRRWHGRAARGAR